MVQIDLLTFVALLQALLIVTALWLIWWLRLRHIRALLRRARDLVGRLRERADPATYLEAELQQTRSAHNSEAEPEPWRQAHEAVLAFELARARAETPDRQPSADALRDALAALLTPPEDPAKAPLDPPPEAPGEAKALDHQDLQEMIARLDRQLEALRTQIDGSVSNTVDHTRMMEKLDALNLVTRELESCARMMEEENDLLREQLQAVKPAN